jgi:hypothetical protein
LLILILEVTPLDLFQILCLLSFKSIDIVIFIVQHSSLLLFAGRNRLRIDGTQVVVELRGHSIVSGRIALKCSGLGTCLLVATGRYFDRLHTDYS